MQTTLLTGLNDKIIWCEGYRFSKSFRFTVITNKSVFYFRIIEVLVVVSLILLVLSLVKDEGQFFYFPYFCR